MKNKFIILTVLAFIVVCAIVLLQKNETNITKTDEPNIPVEADPVDTVMDFYNQWVDARTATDTDPYAAGLNQNEDLTDLLKAELTAAQESFTTENTDPILCISTVPEGLKTRTVSRTDTTALVLLTERGGAGLPIALVRLVGVNGQWKLDNIDCNAGETGPTLGDYTFDRTGFLLKDSVQPPLDPNNWYLVYESDGINGYTAVLNFTDASNCTSQTGESATCPNSLYEAEYVHVQGNMTEAGVEVVQIEEMPQ